jgi:thiamine-phosphate pyrophosphorylase
MTTPEQPQLYLITPPAFELETFPQTLARVLDSQSIACVRLALSTRDEDVVLRAADALREITDARDIALVIADHTLLAERIGLDGVHLTDAARSIRHARKTLGDDAIVGSYCAGSRHDGMAAGEAGSYAELDLFKWWSEVIEVPVVAEGGLDEDLIRILSPYTDFFGIGDEIWASDDPAQALAALIAAMA